MHSFAPAAPAMQQAMATRSMSVQMQSKEELAAALNPAIGYFDPLGLGTADFWTQGNECAAPYGIAPGSRGRWRRRSQRHEATQPTLRYARTRRRVPLVAPPLFSLCVASAPSPIAPAPLLCSQGHLWLPARGGDQTRPRREYAPPFPLTRPSKPSPPGAHRLPAPSRLRRRAELCRGERRGEAPAIRPPDYRYMRPRWHGSGVVAVGCSRRLAAAVTPSRVVRRAARSVCLLRLHRAGERPPFPVLDGRAHIRRDARGAVVQLARAGPHPDCAFHRLP